MKRKDKQPLFELTKEKLEDKLNEAKKEFVKLLMEQKIKKYKDLHAPRKKRKEIAILKTTIRQKELLNQTQKVNHED